ncbi:MAG: hypothetical protein PHG02_05485 [Oscillospiraceae bacterium]|nr:hypothetical protein [Oscillospiraceae bacterium]
MKCTQCRREGTGNFCQNCGAPLTVLAPVTTEIKQKKPLFFAFEKEGYVTLNKWNIPIVAFQTLRVIFAVLMVYKMAELISWFNIIEWGMEDMPLLIVQVVAYLLIAIWTDGIYSYYRTQYQMKTPLRDAVKKNWNK